MKLSGDWNGDGRWPEDFDDWTLSLGERGELRSPLALYIQDSLSRGIPLRYLQLAVEGGEGSYAIFSDVEFLQGGEQNGNIIDRLRCRISSTGDNEEISGDCQKGA